MMPQWPIPIKGMIIVSSFTTDDNTANGIIQIISEEETVCPLCGGELKYRDSRKRITKDILGDIRRFLLRRLRCIRCNKLHTEIPDIILPYKRYDTEAVQSVLDGAESASACAADDSTMRRWRTSFAEAEADMEQRVTSIYARERDEPVGIICGEKAITRIRNTEPRWLPFVIKLLIVAGHVPCARFAFCPKPRTDKVYETTITVAKGGAGNDKTVNDTG
jgi:hypothetical protein